MNISSYAMEGEDIILGSLLRNMENGTFFDIGCSEPIKNSNTYFFYQRGWRGVAVDGRDLSEQWERTRPGDRFVHSLLGDDDSAVMDYWMFPDPTMNTLDKDTAVRYASRFSSLDVKQISVPIRRSYEIYRENCGEVTGCETAPPDIVSIDVEGFEILVLRGLLEPNPNWRPALLVVETKLFNFLRPLDNDIVDYLVNKHSYSLIAKTPLNAFFVDSANAIFDWVPSSMLTKSK